MSTSTQRNTRPREKSERTFPSRIASQEEKSKAVGQTQKGYLTSELEKFNEAVGYDAYLDKAHKCGTGNWEYEMNCRVSQQRPLWMIKRSVKRCALSGYLLCGGGWEQMKAAGYGFHP